MTVQEAYLVWICMEPIVLQLLIIQVSTTGKHWKAASPFQIVCVNIKTDPAI